MMDNSAFEDKPVCMTPEEQARQDKTVEILTRVVRELERSRRRSPLTDKGEAVMWGVPK